VGGAIPAAPRERSHGVACAITGVLAGLVYLNALHNLFIYDDHHLIVENVAIQHLFDIRAIVLQEITRPMVNLSYALDRAIFGPEPFGFHVTNVVLHVLNTMLLFQLALRLLEDARRGGRDVTLKAVRPELVAFGAAILFAVHPMMSEAVGYASGRSEVLCALFFLGAFLSARRWMLGRGTVWWLVAAACWTAALGSKEVGAMLPFVLFCYDRLVLGGTREEKRRRLLRLHLPFIASALAAGVLRVGVLAMVEHPGQTAVHWEFLLVDLDVIRRYVGLMLVPEGQTIFHAVPLTTFHDPRAYGSIGVVALMIWAAWRLRGADSPASLGLLWFLILLVPSAVLVLLDRAEPMAEHRVYIAALGLCLAAGSVVEWLVERARRMSVRVELAATLVFVMVIMSLAGRTILRNVIWGNPVGLWEEARDKAPDHWLPHLLLGEALHNSGHHFEAAAEYSQSMRLRPEEDFTYRKLGLCLIELKQYETARQLFARLRKAHRESVTASLGLGAVATSEGNAELARAYFMEAIGQDTNNVTARESLVLLDESEPANPLEALRLCREIRVIAPGTPGNDDCIRRNEARLAAPPAR
jgi:Flp pilus assembly protein TadD